MPSGWHISANPKGWTSNIHGQEWLEKWFKPATRQSGRRNATSKLRRPQQSYFVYLAFHSTRHYIAIISATYVSSSV